MHITSATSTCPIKIPYLNNAHNIAPLQIQLSEKSSSLQEQVHNVLQEIIPSFLTQESHPCDLNVQPLTGGLSNHLLTVRYEHEHGSVAHVDTNKNYTIGRDEDISPSSTILIRIHDSGGDVETEDQNGNKVNDSMNHQYSIVDRDYENGISAALSSQNLAPTFFGRFENGRLEEFYENVRPLSHTEMGTSCCHDKGDSGFTAQIARQLSKLHNVQLHKSLKKENGDCCHGDIWGRVDEWIDVINDLYDPGINSQERIILKEVQEEWQWLQREIGPISIDQSVTKLEEQGTEVPSKECIERRAVQYCRDIVFTHMDCQSLNILTPVNLPACSSSHNDGEDITPVTQEIRLIDFEYAGMNPRAADIGNTFAEFSDMNNLTPDYENEYPSESCQNIFFLNYLRVNGDAMSEEFHIMSAESRELFLAKMRDETGKHSLISHLGWACWALIQCKTSTIQFDYVGYAKIRMDGYRLFKARHWPK